MVSIDNVYKTVLTILNKEKRGYITPREFNDYARQAQLEIFESYFSGVNRSLSNNSDYSDTKRNVEEKISFLENEATIATGSFTNASGATTSDYFAYPSDFYRLSVVSTTTGDQFIEEISNKKFLFVNKSPFTKPSITSPVYLTHENGLVIKPTGIPNVSVSYVRKPSEPQWVGGTANGQIIVNTSGVGFKNFELHPSEETELVAKILTFAGVTLRAPDLVQATAQKESQIIQSEQ
jgi:hypothetical protein